jgi:(p)ppGpp synthase/HD superfamily hydrolase
MKYWSQELYLKAWNYASIAHNGQCLPGCDLPYITHIATVAMEVIAAITRDEGVENPDLAIQCALLHDVIEDTSVSFEDLKRQFGQKVAQGVMALSKNPCLAKNGAQMHDSLARIRQQPQEIWMVKLADRVANLQPPPKHWPISKIANYHAQAIEILETLASASKTLSHRLETKIQHYRQYL